MNIFSKKLNIFDQNNEKGYFLSQISKNNAISAFLA